MKHGDFTELAKNYISRPAYSHAVINGLVRYMSLTAENMKMADVGAGTGKLTKELLSLGITVDAVEPNDSMRKEGLKYTSDFTVNWSRGTGELTGLTDKTYDWATMASSFHWTDPEKSLPEFHRILKDDGFFTIIWNPRDIQRSELHTTIENKIYEIVPELNRVSSGGKSHTQDWYRVLPSTGHFKDVMFMEMEHEEVMSKERYMRAWRSVNDIRVQAGEGRFNTILNEIETIIAPLDEVVVPYKMRSWTVQKVN